MKKEDLFQQGIGEEKRKAFIQTYVLHLICDQSMYFIKVYILNYIIFQKLTISNRVKKLNKISVILIYHFFRDLPTETGKTGLQSHNNKRRVQLNLFVSFLS